MVDNASTDDSLILFKDRISNLIINIQNLGFGKACNQAFAGSNADYILLLNFMKKELPEILHQRTLKIYRMSLLLLRGIH